MSRKKKPFKLPPEPRNVPELSALLDDYMAKHAKSFTRKRITVQDFIDSESPAVRFYPGAFLSSEDFSHVMTHLERSCYFLLLLNAWEQPIKCFLSYDLFRFTIRCQITPRRFLKIWERILSTKFMFAKHGGQVYIYNYRLFVEFIKQFLNQEKGRKGGEATQKKESAEGRRTGDGVKTSPAPRPSSPAKLHPFNQSPYFDKNKFIAEMKKDPDFAELNLTHYHKRLEVWSNKGGTCIDWIAMAGTFIMNDAKDGKVKTNKGVTTGEKQKIEKGLSKIHKSTNDLRGREEEIRQNYAAQAGQ